MPRQSTIFRVIGKLEVNVRKYFEKTYQDGFQSFLKELRKALENEEKKFVVTANPETFMIGEKHAVFKKVLEDSRVQIVPDGIGVVKAAQLLKYPVKERVTGVEICQELLVMANELKKSIYLFGAQPVVVETLVEKIKAEYPDVVIAGYTDGYVKDKQAVFDGIVEKAPDIILVALGIPQQELLIYNNYERLNKGIMIGVGGSFDVLSGTKKRAPEFFVKYNLEWLYRITKEPKRMKRFFVSNIKFVFKVFKLVKEGK